MRTIFKYNRNKIMKEKIVNYLLVLITITGVILSIVFVYQDLSSEIKEIRDKSSKSSSANDIFLDDRAMYQEQIWLMQNKLDIIQANTTKIADQLQIDIIEITTE